MAAIDFADNTLSVSPDADVDFVWPSLANLLL
jgi:hypothetical protein